LSKASPDALRKRDLSIAERNFEKMRSVIQNSFENIIVTFAVLGLMISACKDHKTAHSGHDASHSQSGQISQTQSVAVLAPAEGAGVKILTPTQDQVFSGDQIPLKFELVKGKRGQHVHAYVDGELIGMFESRKGTLTGVQPGKHILELRVVTSDHKTELDATDKVNFSVQK
jgi:hypothetical protein